MASPTPAETNFRKSNQRRPPRPPKHNVGKFWKNFRSAVEHWARGARGAAAEVKFLRGVYTILFALCFDAFKQRVRNAVAWLHADPETQEKMTNAGALDTPKTQQATA